jgi:putative protein kinase ArgK-like GTPase of G3E family
METTDYSVRREVYICDCYYRLITEIFFLDWDKLRIGYHKLIVTGNPGVGKSSLMFLFIRVLQSWE